MFRPAVQTWSVIRFMPLIQEFWFSWHAQCSKQCGVPSSWWANYSKACSPNRERWDFPILAGHVERLLCWEPLACWLATKNAATKQAANLQSHNQTHQSLHYWETVSCNLVIFKWMALILCCSVLHVARRASCANRILIWNFQDATTQYNIYIYIVYNIIIERERERKREAPAAFQLLLLQYKTPCN